MRSCSGLLSLSYSTAPGSYYNLWLSVSLLDSSTTGSEENLLLSAYLRSSAPPWFNTFRGSHSKYSTTDYGLTGPALMLWAVIDTTVVTILRFTIIPTTAVVCFRWVLFCGSIVHTSFQVLLIVPVTVSAVVPILGLTPHHSYYCHGLTL